MAPFYQVPPSPTLSGTLDTVLPPGFIGNGDVQGRAEFIQEQKDRKYTRWEVAEAKAEVDPQTRKARQQKSGYIIDESEQY